MTSAILKAALAQPLTRVVLGPAVIWLHESSRYSTKIWKMQEPDALVINTPLPSSPALSEASSSPKELTPTLEEIANTDYMDEQGAHELPSFVMAIRPVPKAPRKVWPAWARSHGLGNDQVFRLKRKDGHIMLRGKWEGDKYFLTTPRIAPIPPGREADAQKNGWGVPIKCDSPSHAVRLVKMSLGEPFEVCKRSQAYELEFLRGTHMWQRVYR